MKMTLNVKRKWFGLPRRCLLMPFSGDQRLYAVSVASAGKCPRENMVRAPGICGSFNRAIIWLVSAYIYRSIPVAVDYYQPRGQLLLSPGE